LQVSVVLNKEEYEADEKAELAIISPIFPSEALLYVSVEGVVHWERFHMDTGTTTR
jgi:uncharacterized protein YfaS (alpha-2-macroglobulin family)